VTHPRTNVEQWNWHPPPRPSSRTDGRHGERIYLRNSAKNSASFTSRISCGDGYGDGGDGDGDDGSGGGGGDGGDDDGDDGVVI